MFDSLQTTTKYLEETYNWFVQSTGKKPREFIPCFSYSRNEVYLAVFDTYKETVKAIPHDSFGSIQKDIEITQILDTLKFPVPSLLDKGSRGNLIFIRRKYLEGRIGAYWMSTDQKDTVLTLIGQTIRKLHKVSVDQLPCLSKDWQTYITSLYEHGNEVLHKLNYKNKKEISEILHKFINELDSEKITFLHNDLTLQNIAMEKDENTLRVTGIWDFENAMVGDPIWDLSMTKKTSFFSSENDFQKVVKAYSDYKLDGHKIEIYLMLIILESLYVRYNQEMPISEELDNLDKVYNSL